MLSNTFIEPSDDDYEFGWDVLTENYYDFLLFYATIIDIIKQVYDIAAFTNFFVNIPHLFILTRKELRSNLVYIIMTGICICDLIYSIGKMAQIFLTWQIVYKTQSCKGVFPYYHVIIDVISKCVQIMARRCSGFLALFIAGFRAFSIIFPMSNSIDILTKPKSGYLIILFFGVICTAWSSLYWFMTIVSKVLMCPVGKTPSWVMYEQKIFGEKETRIRLIDGYIAIVVSLLYVFLAIALVCAIAQAKQRRKNLKSDNATNTSMLIGMMAVFMLISEMVYGTILLMMAYIFHGYQEQAHFSQLELFAMTLAVLNSIAHCFICYFMSSQYRSVVKDLLCCGKKKNILESKIVVVESPTSVKPSKTWNSSVSVHTI